MSTVTALEIVEIATGEVVKSLPTNGKTERQIEICLRGLLRNMNTDKFYVREVSK